MSQWTRRDILKLGLSSLAISPIAAGARRARRPSTERPRYHLLVLLGGGFDAIYTTDPKVAREVDAGVDLPYRADEIVHCGLDGDLLLGPHFAPLARWGKKLAILNGVQTGVANHETGSTQFARLRTKVRSSTPSVLDVIARYRDGQPLGTVSLGPSVYWDYSPGWFGTPDKVVGGRAANDPNERNLLDEIDATEVADLQRLAAVARRHASSLRDGGRGEMAERMTTAQNLEETAALFERLPSIPRFTLETWSADAARQNIARNLQRILWLFENDLTSCVFLRVGVTEWDSHYDNAERQRLWNLNFATQLDRFLAELETRSNRHGSLISKTVTVIGSEVGRFPFLNPHKGKDHFPEAPFLFVGAGIRGGRAHGRTGRKMEAKSPVSLDDLGTTLLHMAGIDPAQHGYFGQRLAFLETA
jgi:uncharacterized protein (DUF1501 family)